MIHYDQKEPSMTLAKTREQGTDPVFLKEFEAEFKQNLANFLAKGHGDSFYAQKYRVRPITDDEANVCQWIVDHRPNDTIFEVGSGLCQIPLYLARLGKGSVACEHSLGRLAGARWMLDHVHGGNSVRLVSYTYPTKGTENFDLLITSDIVDCFWGYWNIPEGEKIEKFFKGKDAIIDARSWWKTRNTEDEQQQLISHLSAFGYEAEKVSGSFYLLKKVEAH